MTADALYKGYFTEDAADFTDSGCLYAAFFLDRAGVAVHVAGWCGDCYLNESRNEPAEIARFRTEAELRRMYPHLAMRKRGLRL